jgi:hypothetical protein
MQVITTNTTTNTYHFTVSLPGGLASNQLPVTLITSPAYGANNVTNLPTFTWQGQPTNWPVSGNVYVQQYYNNGAQNFYYPASLPAAQSNWTPSVPLPANSTGIYTYFSLGYVTNYTGTLFVAAAPVNTTNSQTISGWAYNSILESGDSLNFAVAAPPSSSSNHTLIAHYAFDNNGNLGMDSSTNGNDLLCSSGWGVNPQQFVTDSVAGGGAVQFFGQSSLTPCGGSQQLSNWNRALIGSFTVSTWIKTTTVAGNDGDQLYDFDGQNVIYLNNNFNNGVIPLGITGTKAAFETGGPAPATTRDTLHSTNTVTSGSYVHVVVTRDQGSGVKQIYINGVLDSWDYGEPGILDGGANYASIGGEASGAYTGKLDDVQIYSGVLDAFEVTNLYTNPGTTAPNGPPETPGSVLGDAVDAPNLTWTTYGDANWYAETTNTHDGVAAVESGIVTNNQVSTLQTTVVGPGTVSFWWQCWDYSLTGNNYDVEFNTNGVFVDSLTPDAAWTQNSYPIAPGTNVLTWNANAFGDVDPTEASFLDQFTFTPSTPPSVLMQNPQLNGTNFQFQFLSVSGRTHYILSTTNLLTGPWVTNSTVTGDGTAKLIAVPYASPSQKFFRICTQ